METAHLEVNVAEVCLLSFRASTLGEREQTRSVIC